MSSIDERVVKATFDNGQFERGVRTTIDSLAALKKGLNLDGAAKGIQDVNTAASKFSLAGMATGIQDIASKFSALSVIGITALTNIVNKAINAGTALSKSLTLDPIKAGFDEYELKMGSIQTILSNTARYGTKLPEVTRNLDELNTYADKTIYNFGDMTKNIGLFTNAGIKVGDATSMIKGFSNEAASSGTSAQGAASAAYQLSQALSAGKVTLMDWRSLQNVGMGNKNMQNGILDIAGAMGTLEKKGLTAKGVQKDFNGSLEKGWLSADVMSNYLKIMAGDMSAAEMKTLGLSNAQIKMFQVQQKNSEDAATKVRTFTQLLGTMRESVGSGWSETFDTLIGDFDQATSMWTSVNNTLGGMIGDAAKARNDLIKGWADMGGRQMAIDAIANSFKALMAFIKPIKDAFRDIFPAMTAQRLVEITKAIRDFTAGLKIGGDTANKLRRVFQGVFAAIDIGWIIIKKVAGVFVDLFKSLDLGGSGILDFAVKIADWVTGLRYAIKYGDGLNNFFAKLTAVLKFPISMLKNLGAVLVSVFQGDGGTASVLLGRLIDRLKTFGSVGDGIGAAWDKVKGKLQGLMSFLAPLIGAVKGYFQQLGDAINNGLASGDFSGILDAVNTGLFAGLVVIMKKFLSNGLNVDIGGGFLSKIGDAFDGLTGSLEAMQTKLKADALFKIAAALGILTASIVVISLIDSAALTKALVAISFMFVQLSAGLALMDKAVGGAGAIKMPLLAGSLILLATAVVILAGAVRMLSGLSWEELAKGLGAVVVLLLAISAATQLMKSNKNMISTGLGMIAIAIAIKILASAVKDFASMDWQAMAKGLVGVGAVLGALAIFTRLADLNKMGVSSGAGLVLLALSLKIMASAVGDFAGMDWETLGRGFAGMAVSLGLITLAMNLMPANMPILALGLVAVSAALLILSVALKQMGGMSWEEIAKGLIVLAGSLGILAGALYLMEFALPGAAALIVAAGALAILAPVLQVLGNMSLQEIGMALLTLVGVFAVLGVAGLLMGPVVPVLIGLGIAIALLGAGTALAGLGLLAMSAGLTALSAAGVASGAAITAIGSAIIGLIPMALKAVGEGLVLLANVISKSAPAFLNAMVVLMTTLLTAIATVAPKIITTLLGLIGMLLNKLVVAVPQFVTAGMKILIGFLNGIGNNIGKVVTAATNIIVNLINGIANNLSRVITAGTNLVMKFLDGISKAIPKIVAAGIKMVIDTVNGIANAIRGNTAAMNAAGSNLAGAIVQGMVSGIGNGISSVVQAAKNLASNALQAAKNFLGIASPSKEFTKIGRWSSEGMAIGITKYSGLVSKASEGAGRTAIDSMRKTIAGLGDIVASDMNTQPVIRPVLDLSGVRKDAGQLRGMLPASGISVGATYTSARTALAVQTARAQQASVVDDSPDIPVSVQNNYTQNISSPKALSEVEVYRNTKSLISVKKGEVNV